MSVYLRLTEYLYTHVHFASICATKTIEIFLSPAQSETQRAESAVEKKTQKIGGFPIDSVFLLLSYERAEDRSCYLSLINIIITVLPSPIYS